MKVDDNLSAIAGVVLIIGLVIVFKAQGEVLTIAATAVGGCVGYLQRRSPQ